MNYQTSFAQGEYARKKKTTRREKLKALALVEHPVHIIKYIFRQRRVSYCGLEKNTGQLRVRFALCL